MSKLEAGELGGLEASPNSSLMCRCGEMNLTASSLLRRRGIIVCLGMALQMCSAPTRRDLGPTPLFGGVTSRISPDDTRLVHRAGDNWRSLGARSRRPGDRRPSTLSVSVAPYSDLGCDGALQLEFVNDELVVTVFFPKDLARYLVALRDQKGLDLVNRIELDHPPGTRIERGTEGGRNFVSWEDVARSAPLAEM